MNFDSTFALLDVKRGRKQLLRRLGTQPSETRIPVTITGFITHAWGRDDGTSIEFAVDVTSVEEIKP
jgi:hypothetical protein